MKKKIQPEFAVGQKVRLKRPDLMGAVEGTVVSFEKVYQTLNDEGEFDFSGLATLESTIDSIKYKTEVKDDLLYIHYPERVIKLADGEFRMNAKVEVSRLRYYAYTIDTGKMLSIQSKKNITAI